LETGAPYLVLPGVVTVGRHEDADIQLAHDSVSRRHAQIHNTEAGVFVQDVGSSNGTFVLSRRIVETTPLDLGMEIIFGSLRFRLDPEVADATQGEEPIPQPVISWDSFQRRTNKIAAHDLYAAKTKTSPTRVTSTESGHLVTVQSAAFPGGAMFPKKTKSSPTSRVDASSLNPPPAAPVWSSGMAQTKSGSMPEVKAPVAASMMPLQWVFVFFSGMGLGILLGLVLAYLLFVR
jgi:predicted component of type VI protein secretion system